MRFLSSMVLAMILIMAVCMAAVSANAATTKAVSVSRTHTLFLMDDGTVWGIGDASRGELGSNVSINSSDPLSYIILTPLKVEDISGVIQIAAGDEFSMALKDDGTVWTWGNNYDGKLGLGDCSDSKTPARVPGLNNVTAIDAYYENAMALCDDGSVWMWGSNLYSQIPNFTEKVCKTPYRIQGIPRVKAIAIGLLLDDNGTIWEMKNSGVYRVGDGSLTGVKAIDAGNNHKLALKEDGTVWAWGGNHFGQLGNGNLDNSYTTPVEVKGLANVKSISAGDYHNIALKGDGTVWAWGMNDKGELGVGISNKQPDKGQVVLPNSSVISTAVAHDFKAVPVQVPGLANIIAISAGGMDSVALADNGAVWGWGDNRNGQLGDMPKNHGDYANISIKEYPFVLPLNLSGNAIYPRPSEDTSPTITPGGPAVDNTAGWSVIQLLGVAVFIVVILGAIGYYFVLRKR